MLKRSGHLIGRASRGGNRVAAQPPIPPCAGCRGRSGGVIGRGGLKVKGVPAWHVDRTWLDPTPTPSTGCDKGSVRGQRPKLSLTPRGWGSARTVLPQGGSRITCHETTILLLEMVPSYTRWGSRCSSIRSS